MRSLLIIASLFAAITTLNLTGNYFRIRRYLYAQVVATLACELFLLSGGDASSTTYRWIYVLTSLPILTCAVLIVSKLLSHVEDKTQQALWVTVPVFASVVAFHFTPYKPSFVGVYLAVQGFILGVLGAQAIAMSDLVPNRAPHATLGMLWICQSILFLLYACGLQISNVGWERIGEWMPASLVSVAMLKLSVDFWKEPRLANQ